MIRKLLTLLLATALAACASAPLRVAVPEDRYRAAALPGYGQVRVFGDIASEEGRTGIEMRWQRSRERLNVGDTPSYAALVLSGGADDGAFGVGVLNGWTEHGDRPEFDVVTGVSTGALIAPLAFLGSEYDDTLRETFLSTQGARDVFRPSLSNVLSGSALSLATSEPLKQRIDEIVDARLLAKIAAQHRRGRALIVGTTNLDARRPVLWDIGAIAASSAPDRLELVRKVILASASIPGLAPPVLIPVEVDGTRYREIHVDGGVSSTIAFAAPGLSLRNPDPARFPARWTVYAIQNNKLQDAYGPTQDSLLAIASDTISAMIRSQGRGDQLRLFYLSQRDGFDYRLATVPDDFRFERTGPFDPAYMAALYDLGYRAARRGYRWRRVPPGLNPAETEAVGGPERLSAGDRTPAAPPRAGAQESAS